MAKPVEKVDEAALESGRLLFSRECRFVIGAARLDQLPDISLPEVAFSGRSNVGKSSLVNALTGRKTLARTSNTPGRTQQLNFFDLDGRLMLVDLPGHGFAQAPKDMVRNWQHLVDNYLRGRPNLRRVCLLIDSRHGLKTPDLQVMEMLDAAAVTYQIVLTKSDKIKGGAQTRLIEQLEKQLKKHVAAHPQIMVTSAFKNKGIAELRAELASLAAA